MINLGHSITNIAEQRGLTTSTIENHLSYYVSNGKLSVKNLLSGERITAINNAIDKVDSIGLAPIKELLGDEYSYGEIRMVLGHRQLMNNVHSKVTQSTDVIT